MPQAAPGHAAELSSILILQLCPIGDTLFGTPAIRALRCRFPRARLTVVTWSSNREVVAGNSHVDRVVAVKDVLSLPRALSRLADEGYDAVVGLSNVGSWLAGLFASSTVRVGFNSQTLGRFYTEDVPDRRNRHAVDYCLDVVAALGAEPQGRHLEIFLSPADRAAARALLGHGEGGQRPPLCVALHPGGRYFPAKRWSTRGFAFVADYLAGQYGAQVVMVGGPDDVPLARSIVDQCRLAEPLVLTGRASLKQTASVIERCDLFVGNDSAPMHLAVAVGTPVVALFGPTSVDNFQPLGPHDVVVRKSLSCSPCFRWLGGSLQHLALLRDPDSPALCMQLITPHDVIIALERQLDRLGLRAERGLDRPDWLDRLPPAPAAGEGEVARDWLPGEAPWSPVASGSVAWALTRGLGRRRWLLSRTRARRLRWQMARRYAAPHKVQELGEL